MPARINLHPVSPQPRLVFQVVDALRDGAVVLLPTDTRYALACACTNHKGVERIRRMRRLPDDHTFTLLCDSMAGLATFARIGDAPFKLIRRLIPGPFTFVLPGTKSVPALLLSKKRKTTGFRVPDHPILQQLLAELGEPLLAVSAAHPDGDQDFADRIDLMEYWEKQVDLVVDPGTDTPADQTTVLDLTGPEPVIVRLGGGWDRARDAFALNGFPFSEDGSP